MPTSPPPALPPRARLLLVRMSALGDIVFALPALRLLRRLRPHDQIEWLCEDRHQGILAEHPDLDAVHVFPRQEGTISSVKNLWNMRRAGPYDAVVDFQSNFKSAMHLLGLRASRKIGFAAPVAREMAQIFINEPIIVNPRCNRSDRDLRLIEQLLGDSFDNELASTIKNDAHPWPVSSSSIFDECEILLHCTTTNYGQDKAWSAANWISLAQELKALGKDVRFLWAPSEKQQVESIAVQACCKLAPATSNLGDLINLTDNAGLLIGTDSGPLHLASWRGTKTIGLFGPTDSMVYASPGPNTKVISALPSDQAPPKRDRSGPSPLMDRISVEKVLELVD